MYLEVDEYAYIDYADGEYGDTYGDYYYYQEGRQLHDLDPTRVCGITGSAFARRWGGYGFNYRPQTAS